MAITNTRTGLTFNTIQDAINAAEAEDVISVSSGIYNENITINKAITLQGANQGIRPTAPDIDPNIAPDAPVNGIDINQGYENRNPEAWIQGTVTVAADNVTIDGFRLRNEAGPLSWEGKPNNFKLLNNYVTGYNADNAPQFGDPNSNNPTNEVFDWEISGNYIGGLTDGSRGSMYLAGLSNSSISNNTFWRPRAAHLYVASLTNVTIDDNNFFHGLHTPGFDEDDLGQYFSGASYGYGRNYWLELKGTNNTVNIQNNTGEFNSGGIQLYSEPNQASPYVFDNITIQGNNFPSTNFVNPYTEVPTNGLSGVIPAVMATAAVDGASGNNLVIRGNTVSLDLSQIRFATDHNSSLEVRGNFEGVTVENNTVSPVGANDSDAVDLLTGLNLYGNLSGAVVLQNNQFLGSGGNPDDALYYGVDFIPTFPDYGTFTTGNLAVRGNTINNWQVGVVLRLLGAEPDPSNRIDIRDNTFNNNEITVFDQVAPEIFTSSIVYTENQALGSPLGTVDAADNLANTNNVGIVQYLINDPSGFFEIDPITGVITLTAAGVASAANNFLTLPNSFPLSITVSDAGGITFSNTLEMRIQDPEGREVLVNASDSPPGATVSLPQDQPGVLVATNQPNTLIPSPFADRIILTQAVSVPITIQGTLVQLNLDVVSGFAPRIHRLLVQDAIFRAPQVNVRFGSAILEIDANDDGNIDSTITLEGDFSEALFLVNPDENTNSTDIRYDILNSRINRFQNKDVPGTFLFAGEEESRNIRENFPQFEEEGYAFKVTTEGSDSLMRLNRFQNRDVPGTYLFANEEESQSIRANFPQFVEEGIAAYVAAPGSSTGESIYRFQNRDVPGTYIFVGEQERNNIIANFPQFALEGEAFEIVV